MNEIPLDYDAPINDFPYHIAPEGTGGIDDRLLSSVNLRSRVDSPQTTMAYPTMLL
jgi:hypothetical protein